jgi:hypothetical protein
LFKEAMEVYGGVSLPRVVSGFAKVVVVDSGGSVTLKEEGMYYGPSKRERSNAFKLDSRLSQ